MVDPITAGLTVALVSGGILALVRRRWEIADIKSKARKEERDIVESEIKKLKENHQTMIKSIWRLNKTIVIMAKIIDDQTAKVHSELISSLEDIAHELLREPVDYDQG